MSWDRTDFNALIRKECGGKRPKYLSKFWEYHDANPHVFKRYMKIAKYLEAQGFERIGVKGIAEDLRWKTTLKTQDADGFKVSNILVSLYARLLVFARPSLGGMISLRTLGIPGERSDQPAKPFAAGKVQSRSLALRVLWTTGHWPGEEL